jgi:hypothetical protein
MNPRLFGLRCLIWGLVLIGLPFTPSIFGQTNLDIDHHDIPVQPYAMIDISGASTNGNPVEMMALDDANNAAFSFWEGNTHKVGRWRNGALEANSPKVTANRLLVPNPGGTPNPVVVEGLALKEAGFDLNVNGDMAAATPGFWSYGQAEAYKWTFDDPYSEGFGGFSIFALLDNDLMYGQGIVANASGYHVGQVACGKVSPLLLITSFHAGASSSEIDNSIPTAVSSAGKIAIYHDRFVESAPEILTYEVYIGDGDAGSWDKVDEKTEDGSRPKIVSINDTKDALITYSNVTPPSYLIQNGVVSNREHFLKFGADPGLIAPHPGLQLRNVVPMMMSNRRTVNGSAVQPVLNIIVRADERMSATSNTWRSDVVFLLRLMSDGTTDLREIGTMDPATNLISIPALNVIDLQFNSINSSGVIAAIGSIRENLNTPTSTQALLLVPGELVLDGVNGKRKLEPGAFVPINGNNDNGSSVIKGFAITRDYQIVSPLEKADPDLKKLKILAPSNGLTGWTFCFDIVSSLTSGDIRIWTDAKKTSRISLPHNFAANELPATVYVEGVHESYESKDIMLKLDLIHGTKIVPVDKVMVSVSPVLHAIEVLHKSEVSVSNGRKRLETGFQVNRLYRS